MQSALTFTGGTTKYFYVKVLSMILSSLSGFAKSGRATPEVKLIWRFPPALLLVLQEIDSVLLQILSPMIIPHDSLWVFMFTHHLYLAISLTHL